MIFELLQQKWCRIIMSFRQNTISGPETCQIGPKLWLPSCPDLPRPVQEDKYLLQTSGNAFIFSDFTKSCVLLNKFIIFCKITCFTKQTYYFCYKITCFTTQIYICLQSLCFIKQIYEDKSLSQNHVYIFLQILCLLYL